MMIATPDVTPETFQQNAITTTTAARDGVEMVFVENVYDPDPADEQYETTVLYLIREQVQLRVESDHWTLGIFTLDTWRQVLADTGFQVHECPYRMDQDEYTLLACVKTG